MLGPCYRFCWHALLGSRRRCWGCLLRSSLTADTPCSRGRCWGCLLRCSSVGVGPPCRPGDGSRMPSGLCLPCRPGDGSLMPNAFASPASPNPSPLPRPPLPPQFAELRERLAQVQSAGVLVSLCDKLRADMQRQDIRWGLGAEGWLSRAVAG